MQLFLTRLDKFFQVLKSRLFLHALLLNRSLVAAEHRFVLKNCNAHTVIDIGANRGQFALAVCQWLPNAKVISFEPLAGPAQTFRSVFKNDHRVVLHKTAIGPNLGESQIHISARDDSSSLLPIAELQSDIFPGTVEVDTQSVRVAPLDSFLKKNDIQSPALLKLDVQGFEYEALQGCESLLNCFDAVYCECSFVELYLGQKKAADVIAWLAEHSFVLQGIYNTSYDKNGLAVQADFLFKKV